MPKQTSLIALIMISAVSLRALEHITSQHMQAGLEGWIASALPHFFPRQSTGLPTQGHHLCRGPAAPVPCWGLLLSLLGLRAG